MFSLEIIYFKWGNIIIDDININKNLILDILNIKEAKANIRAIITAERSNARGSFLPGYKFSILTISPKRNRMAMTK